MIPALVNQSELYFECGGPAYRLSHRVAHKLRIGHSFTTRILGFLAITWFPILFFSVIEGRALGPEPRDSFLLDFGTYSRFFLGVPLLIVAESVVGPRLRGAGLQFVDGGFVPPEAYPDFNRAILLTAKLRESVWAELVILAVAVTGAWLFTAETFAGEVIATWRSPSPSGTGFGMSLTALWYRLIALPILQFFWYRWLWRLLCWAIFLWTVSRLNLNLVGTHADQAGGLGFLGTAHSSLGIFAFALSSVLSAEAAFLMFFQGTDIDAFKVPFVVLLVLVELIVLGPLLTFVPILIRTRLAWLRDYSIFLSQYNRDFHQKWIISEASPKEPLLGSADIQSLADLGNNFERIQAMKVVPFSMRVVVQLAIVTSLPCIPLLLLVMPISDVLNLLSKAVF